MSPIDSFEFSHNGHVFVARVYADDYHDAPWAEEDFHIDGIDYFARQSDIPRGYHVLSTHGSGYWAFPLGPAIVKAAREGWRSDGWHARNLRVKPGKSKITRAQRTYAAVLDDAARMAGYINGDWCYVGVSVTPVGEDEDFSNALWGLESDSGDYLRQVALELLA